MLLSLIKYPDPILTTPSVDVDLTNGVPEEIKNLLIDMAETMYRYKGVGLSAPQIGKNINAIVMDTMQDQPGSSELMYLINPVLYVEKNNEWFPLQRKGDEKLKGHVVSTQEGCLSFPFVFDFVERYKEVKVKAFNEKGEPLEFLANGDLSICVQHEVDHLQGIVFTDRMSRLKRKSALQMNEAQAKRNAKVMLTSLHQKRRSLNIM